MKKIDENGYITSLLLLVLLIPIIFLLITTINDTNNINETTELIQSDRIQSITNDFEEEIESICKKSIQNITITTIQTKQPLKNSSQTIIQSIQKSIEDNKEKYEKQGYLINCTISDLTPNNNPFKINLKYILKVTSKKNKDIKIQKTIEKKIDLTDSKYPIYDPLPTLKTGISVNESIINYTDYLSKFIKKENNTAYLNSISGSIIKECPYENYEKHGHSNITLENCINNHYYHKSNDGLCLLCRLENKTSCSVMGIETFILPTQIMNNAPVSIDHVLFNDTTDGQYNGNLIYLNNTTILYLDNGHKAKYGL